ncbi:putative polygalacturonase [Medicago truncatula]|uniref:Putative polygalacturonase n=1 Tax=Medicago truncatula TaxID=3880 RepID=A0A396H0N4_MEDTR|nr:putative polygalacturonase [Medicago truncatula]
MKTNSSSPVFPLMLSVLILCFVSPCLCKKEKVFTNHTNIYDVMQHGARGDGKSDDTNAFLKAWSSTCGAGGILATLVIPKNKSFLVNNLVLTGGCKATSIHIKLDGKIVAPAKGALKDKSYWIRIQYINHLTIDGGIGGSIEGYGSTWWQCKTCSRPTFCRRVSVCVMSGVRVCIDGFINIILIVQALFFHSSNDLTVRNLRITNTPGAHIAINGCIGATFSQILVNSPGNSPNTDGFDISYSKNITVVDSTIATGDDCIAVNGGSSYIYATRVACGPGHGISIGSLGKGNSFEVVEEVHVRNCNFTGSTNGARIKTFPGGSGYARKITFEQIQLKDVKNAIIIDQNYGAKMANNKMSKGSSVQVSDVTFRRFKGTSASDIGINLKCMGCSNIILDQIDIVSSQGRNDVKAFCQNFHGIIYSTLPKVLCN